VTIEIIKNILHIRIKSPDLALKFATQDVGTSGKLQRVAAYYKDGGWQTQSWRIRVSEYTRLADVMQEVEQLNISQYKKDEAKKLIKKWWHIAVRKI